MELSWTTFAGIALGIGLAAATGFRVFLPLLLAGLAAHFGYIPLAENFQWLASIPALVMLGTAAAADDRTGAPDGGLPTAVAVFRTEPESTSACVTV